MMRFLSDRPLLLAVILAVALWTLIGGLVALVVIYV